jgi:hypothetical protein
MHALRGVFISIPLVLVEFGEIKFCPDLGYTVRRPYEREIDGVQA